MHRLTRQVRFAVNGAGDPQLSRKPTNGFGGFPSLTGFGPHLSLDVTLSGPIDPLSSYLINIRQIDATVREVAIPAVARAVIEGQSPARLTGQLYDMLGARSPLTLEELRLNLSPFLSYARRALEPSMIRLSQRFEFSATHRLHNPQLSEDDNRRVFGKCANPHGHGHNYELQVTLAGEPDANGLIMDIPDFESVVASAIVERFDHKNLNLELPEFRDLIPTVENIAMVIYRLLKPEFAGPMLASVTVWETPKTWCEYSE